MNNESVFVAPSSKAGTLDEGYSEQTFVSRIYDTSLKEDLALSVLDLLVEQRGLSEPMQETSLEFLRGCSEKELKSFERHLYKKGRRRISKHPDGYLDEDTLIPDK